MQKYLLAISLLMSTNLYASVQLGIGTTSHHSGRIVPSLSAAINEDSWAASVYSTGSQNEYYYHSAYGLHYFVQKKAGSLWGGEIYTGLGLGAMYAVRGFQDLNATQAQEKSDFAMGPAFRINWVMTRFVFLNFDATFGLRNLGNHLTLNFQDIVSFSLGVNF